jgi:hypothetical protein
MDEYEVHVDKALEALRAVSYRDRMAASKALERTRYETVDLAIRKRLQLGCRRAQGRREAGLVRTYASSDRRD